MIGLAFDSTLIERACLPGGVTYVPGPAKVVGIVEFRGRVIVATEAGVFWLDGDGRENPFVLRPVEISGQ